MAKKFTDPVTLSGGPLGGETIEGEGWWPGVEIRLRSSPRDSIYRRLEDDDNGLTADQAVHCGPAPRD